MISSVPIRQQNYLLVRLSQSSTTALTLFCGLQHMRSSSTFSLPCLQLLRAQRMCLMHDYVSQSPLIRSIQTAQYLWITPSGTISWYGSLHQAECPSRADGRCCPRAQQWDQSAGTQPSLRPGCRHAGEGSEGLSAVVGAEGQAERGSEACPGTPYSSPAPLNQRNLAVPCCLVGPFPWWEGKR